MMSESARLEPSRPVPPLRLKTVGGPCWRLSDQKPGNFTLIAFYRGGNCRQCEELLKSFEHHYDDFRRLGVRVLAVSADDLESAQRTVADWGLDKLTVGWGLSAEQAALWGLTVRETPGVAGPDAPERHVEPAMFLVKPDGTLFGGVIPASAAVSDFMNIGDLLAALAGIVGHDGRKCGCGCAAPTVDHLISTV